GSCMYAIVGSVVQMLAERVGGPYRTFPVAMMRFGEGGIGGWGSTCGVVNGAGAVVGLLIPDDKEKREACIGEFCQWYEHTALPRYRPAQPGAVGDITPSVAGSVLCHLSVTSWTKASGKGAFTPEKRERCRRLTADGAMELVEILNRALAAENGAVTPVSTSCAACHGSKGRGDAMVKMACTPCHTLPDSHPKVP
ncbi:MAG: C-GCAxxG-C-C family protein, partial [Armatimonadota bacterium]|nr:C-GCAxxG-C-C family protein [Armatimonadota bacterium]